MQDQRVERLVQAFSTSLREEIDAAWVVADSMGDDLLPLLAEAFPRIRKSEGRASVMRYVGKFSRESEVAFRMGAVAVQDRAYAVRHSLWTRVAGILAACRRTSDSNFAVKTRRLPHGGRY